MTVDIIAECVMWVFVCLLAFTVMFVLNGLLEIPIMHQ